MLATLAAVLLTGAAALHAPARPLGRRAAIGTAAAASFLPVTTAFAADSEASIIAEIKEIRAKLDGAALTSAPYALPPCLRLHLPLRRHLRRPSSLPAPPGADPSPTTC